MCVNKLLASALGVSKCNKLNPTKCTNKYDRVLRLFTKIYSLI